MTLEDKIAQEVARQVGPLNAVLSQIWTAVQAMQMEKGEPLVDPETGEPVAAPPIGAGEGEETPPAGWFQPLGQPEAGPAPDPQVQTQQAQPQWGPAMGPQDSVGYQCGP